MSLSLTILVLAAYLAGGIPGGVVICRVLGRPDPRSGGSGNIGATNVWRVAGRAAGILALLTDMAKGAAPAWLALNWFGESEAAMTGLAAVVGHCWPVYLGFKGGKGVATAYGSLLVLAPWVGLACAVSTLAIGWKSGRMSLGSLAGTALAPVLLLLKGAGLLVAGFYLAITALVFWRHRGNISRLKAGNEHAWR